MCCLNTTRDVFILQLSIDYLKFNFNQMPYAVHGDPILNVAEQGQMKHNIPTLCLLKKMSNEKKFCCWGKQTHSHVRSLGTHITEIKTAALDQGQEVNCADEAGDNDKSCRSPSSAHGSSHWNPIPLTFSVPLVQKWERWILKVQKYYMRKKGIMN